jgi:hypothetical protein
MKLTELKVKLTLLEQMLGTIPKDKEVYSSFIVTKMREDLEHGVITQEQFDEKGKEELETIDEKEEKGWTGFHTDKLGLFIYDYMIRGFLKNSGLVLKDQASVKNAKSKIDKYVFVFPRQLRLLRKGKPITKPEGVLERPLRAMTPQGPRVTLARSDYVNAGTTIDCTLRILETPEINVKYVKELFEYGQLSGLGQFRNGSYGRFKVEYPKK